MKRKDLKISVRNLVELILRKGDIDNRFTGFARAQEGTIAHKKLQKNNLEIFKDYRKEVYLKRLFEFEDFNIILEGRADGVIVENDFYIIEEIKSTNKELIYISEDYNELHWAQAKCYAYMLAMDKDIEEIGVQLSYFQLEINEVKSFRKKYNKSSLEDFIFSIINKYYNMCRIKEKFKNIRDISIKTLEFPFENYRAGQRQLAISVYNTIRNKGILFANASTGIGKTMSTIFPAVKSIGEGIADKLFYLTAKTITRTVAEDAFSKLKDKGLIFKVITLTAKDKICFEKEGTCNPEECKYAKGYYDRLNDGIFDILSEQQNFSRELIEEYGRKYTLCPFEFSLDLSYWCDGIICDYNYVFDPKVYLKGILDENKERYVFLIDEGHNLVDRGREMFSSEIFKSNILEVKRLLKAKAPAINKALGKINSYFIGLQNEGEMQHRKNFIIDEPKELYSLIRRFIKASEEFLVKNKDSEYYDKVLEVYFQLNIFISIGELYDDSFITYVDLSNKDVKIKLFCIHPRKKIQLGMDRAIAKVIFSATLTPVNYFLDILGGDEGSYKIRFASPFNFNKLFLGIVPISTRYKHREDTIDYICDYIQEFVSVKLGNYMVFFPSYEYMNKVYDKMKNTKINILMQDRTMDEIHRQKFLDEFKENNNESLIGFCVIGGIFSEGIDLIGDNLIGAIIIGVGLPKLCYERELIKDYYDKINNLGYDYAYTYPGMNKVLQASGRVIRTENDKGAILLIDDRFNSNKYYGLMPKEWNYIKVYRNKKQLTESLKNFW